MRVKLPGLALAAAVLAAPAAAQTLNLGVGAPVTSLDPHFHQLGPNNAAGAMIFDRLVNTDASARMVPGLALSWTAVAPDVWEFRLRPGVRFHNGSPFTAEDVAFTFERLPNVPNSPSSFAAFVRPIRQVEILDAHTLRLSTNGPYPLLPQDLTNVFILDRETHQGGTTEQFNSGQLAVGTGPYRVLAHRMGERIDLERHEGYWGEAPAYARVAYRMIINESARTAALLAGDVDAIDQVPTADLARIRGDRRFAVSERVGLRLIFLGVDHMREGASPFVTDHEGRPIAQNPLRDPRVRRALSLAIDRNAIAQRVMEGTVTPAGQFLPPGVFSHVPDLGAPPHDAEAARRLLAEAGFPQGFRLTLHGPNNRYPNDDRIIQAVGQMWTRLGVRTAVEALPWTSFIARANRQEFSAHLLGWGSNPDGSHPLRSIIATPDRERGWGAANRGRYSNPAIDRGLEAAMVELDEARRERMLIDLQRAAFEDLAIIPLHIQTNIWAMRAAVAHQARADESTRAQDFRPR